MTLCTTILTPVIVLVRALVQVVREIVRTVCEWVSSTIRKIVEVVEKVCQWLPWPLSALCKLVTKLVEVVETVWNWVCREVIDRIISWVEVVLEYVFYILKWVCWVVDWIVFRWIEWLLCTLGFDGRVKTVCVHVKILTDRRGVPAVTVDEARAFMRETDRVFRQCNVRVAVERIELVEKEEYLDSTRCNFGGMFSGFWLWMSGESAPCCCVTVFFVRKIKGALGCAYPGTDFIIIGSDVPAERRGCVVAQEIMHLADHWSHTSEPGLVMTNPCGDKLTHGMCCLLRSSRYASATRGMGRERGAGG